MEMHVLTLLVIFLGAGSVQSVCTSGKTAEIDDVLPKAGSFRTNVEIKGCGLSNVDSVQFVASGKATFVYRNLTTTDTRIQFRIDTSSFVPGSKYKIEIRQGASLLNETQADLWTWLQYLSLQYATATEGQSGTRFTIHGCLPPKCGGGTNIEAVHIGQIPATILSQNVSAQSVRVEAGYSPRAISRAVILLETDSGATSVTTFVQFIYLAPGRVTSVDPNQGQQGTLVTIKGTSLLGVESGGSTISGGKDDVESVTLGGIEAAEVISVTTSEIKVKAKSGASQSGVDVKIVTKNGPFVVGERVWTQLKDGVIDAVIPSAGQPGSKIALCGANVLPRNVTITSLTVAGQTIKPPPTPVYSSNASCIIVAVPPLASLVLPPPPGPISLHQSTGPVINSSGISFSYARVDSVTPNAGRQGTYVTVSGQHLDLNTGGVGGAFLGAYPAQIVSANSTSVQLRVSSGPGSVTALGSLKLLGKGKTALNGDIELAITESNVWQYIGPGKVTNVDPDQGQVGTLITITGASLLGLGKSVKSVQLGSLSAKVISSSNTSVQVQVPDGPATGKGVNVTLESITGALTEGAGVWQYLPKGVIQSVEPSKGQLGTTVTIRGTNLRGYGKLLSSASLAGVNAVIQKENDTYVVLRAGELIISGSDQSGKVVLTSKNGAFVTSGQLNWTYIVPGMISEVSANEGQVGTEVTIKGTNLFGGGTRIESVTFSGVAVDKVIGSPTSTAIVVRLGHPTSSAQIGSPGDIIITSDTGSSVILRNSWTYLPEGIVSGISPQSGQFGTKVTISGTQLLGYGTKIVNGTVAGIPIRSVEKQTPTLVVVRVGEGHRNTSGGIVLIADNKAVVSSSKYSFTYNEPGLISDVSPGSGLEGTVVFIRGSKLRGQGKYVASVSLAGVSVRSIFYESDTQLIVKAGPMPSSTAKGRIEIEADSGALVYKEVSFSYNKSQLIRKIDPVTGQQGTRVRIDLPYSAINVKNAIIGDTPADIVSQTGQTVEVSLGRPSKQGSFVGDVAVEDLNGIFIRQKNAFRYASEGVVFSITPDSGQQGTRVNLTGENLLGGGAKIVSATLGGLSAEVVSSSNTLAVIVIRSVHVAAAKTGDVVLTSGTGAAARKVAVWTSLVTGSISSVSPSNGQVGTSVFITGSRLLGGGKAITNVFLSGIKVDKIVSFNDSAIVVVASDGDRNKSVVDVIGSVRIVSDTGAFVESGTAWTYRARGQVLTIAPSLGQYRTLVVIRGTNLLAQGKAVSVFLGGWEALSVESQNDSVILVRSDNAGNVTGTAERVRIVAKTGAYVEASSSWTYRTPGRISSVYPSRGQTGTEVVLKGVGLLCSGTRISAARIGGTPANVLNSTNTEVIISAGERKVNSKLAEDILLIADTGAEVSISGAFSYLLPGKISNVLPRSGIEGNRVVITGSELLGYGLSVRSVTLAGVVATVSSSNSSSIEVTAGNNNRQASTGEIKITSSSGAVVTYSMWNYITPGFISRIEPSSGLQAGQRVTLHGSNLLSGGKLVKEVVINGARSVSAVALNLTEIEVRLGPPPLSGGKIGVTVTLDSGATYSTSTQLFQYSSSGGRVMPPASPSRGYGNTNVTLRGKDLLNGGSNPTVSLAGVSAKVLFANESVVVVESGIGFGVTGDVVISTNGFVSGLHDGWTYLPLISTSSVRPQSGRNGTMIQIRDPGVAAYYPIVSASVAGISARIVSGVVSKSIQSDKNETVAVQENVLTLEAGYSQSQISGGDIVLKSQQGFELLIKNTWSYVALPQIQTVQPLLGYSGTQVTITGINLRSSLNGVKTVTLAGVETTVTSQKTLFNSDVIQVTVGSAATSSGIGAIVIQDESGATFVEPTLNWTYVDVNITSVYPNVGRQGTRVTVSGSFLLAGASGVVSASLAGFPASVVSANNTAVLLVASQSSPSPPGDVRLSMNTGARIIIENQWSYTTAGNITDVQPSTGRGGTEVIIRGENLLGGGTRAEEVYLDEVKALRIITSGPQYVRAVAGLGSTRRPGIVRIVADSGAEVNRSSSFTYQSMGRIFNVLPKSGQFGTEVVITGSFFLERGVEYVKLAGVEAMVVGTPTNSQIRVQAGFPARLDSFSGEVEVRSDTEAISQYSSFKYDFAGRVDSVTPSSGQRGSHVTITGIGLGGGGSVKEVYFGNVKATLLNSSDSQVMVRCGKGNVLGVTNVTVASSTGAEVIRVNGWTYLQPSKVASITPLQGSYGTHVTIVGTGLTNVIGVTIDAIPVFEINEFANGVRVRIGIGKENQTGSVIVTSLSGAEAESLEKFTYTKQGGVALITPTEGVTGTLVRISGENLLGSGGKGIMKATLGGIEALHIVNATQSEVFLTAGFNDDGEAKRDVDLYLESDTGAITRKSSTWSYLPSCKGNQFGNTTRNCQPCDSNCNRCFSFGNENCRECRNFTIPTDTENGKRCVEVCPLFADGAICVKECNTSQYTEFVASGNETYERCLSCNPQCNPETGCTGGSNQECNNCSSVKNNGQCTSECPVDKYEDSERICQQCDEQCKGGCNGSEATDCRACANYGQLTDDSALVKCVANCHQEREFLKDSHCLPCHEECVGCHGPRAEQCQECKNYKKGNACVIACNKELGPQLFFSNDSGACLSCHPQCSRAGCTGQTNADCLGCFNYSRQDKNETRCLSKCSLEEYPDGDSLVCMPCDKDCTEGCTGPTATECISTGLPLFSAGIGTIAVVSAVCALLIALVVIMAVMYCKKTGKAGAYVVGDDLPLDTVGNDHTGIGQRGGGVSETKMSTEASKRPKSQQEPLMSESAEEEQYTDMGVPNAATEELQYADMTVSNPVVEEQYADMAVPVPTVEELYEDSPADEKPAAPPSAQKTFRIPPPPPPEEEDLYEDIDPLAIKKESGKPKSKSATTLPNRQVGPSKFSTSTLQPSAGPPIPSRVEKPPSLTMRQPPRPLPPGNSGGPWSPSSSVPSTPGEDAPMLPSRNLKPTSAPLEEEEDLYEDCSTVPD